MRHALTMLALVLAATPTAASANDESFGTNEYFAGQDLSGDAQLKIYGCQVRANPSLHSVPLVSTVTCTVNGRGQTVSQPGAVATTAVAAVVPDGDVHYCVSGGVAFLDLETQRVVIKNSATPCPVAAGWPA